MIEHKHKYMQDGKAADSTANHASLFSLRRKTIARDKDELNPVPRFHKAAECNYLQR